MVSTRRVAIVFLRVGGCDGGRDAATVPRRSRSGCAEPPCELAEDGTIGTCGGQVDTDAGRSFDHAGGDLDQARRSVANSATASGKRFAIALRAVSISQ